MSFSYQTQLPYTSFIYGTNNGENSDLNMNNHKIINLSPGTNSTDAVNLSQLSSSTSLPLNTISTTNLNTGPVFMNNYRLTSLADPTLVTDGLNVQYADSRYYLNTVPLDQITLATASIDANNQLINNVLDPVSNQDVATRNYVDQQDSLYKDRIQDNNTLPNTEVICTSTNVNTILPNSNLIEINAPATNQIQIDYQATCQVGVNSGNQVDFINQNSKVINFVSTASADQFKTMSLIAYDSQQTGLNGMFFEQTQRIDDISALDRTYFAGENFGLDSGGLITNEPRMQLTVGRTSQFTGGVTNENLSIIASQGDINRFIITPNQLTFTRQLAVYPEPNVDPLYGLASTVNYSVGSTLDQTSYTPLGHEFVTTDYVQQQVSSVATDKITNTTDPDTFVSVQTSGQVDLKTGSTSVISTIDTSSQNGLSITNSNDIQLTSNLNTLTINDTNGNVSVNNILDMNVSKIIQLADGTLSTDAINLGQADAKYVLQTTPLNNITAPTGSLSLNSQKITDLADATLATDALNRQTGDGRYYLNTTTLDNITLATASIDANNQLITNVLDPVSLQDVATRNYVDSQIASGVVDKIVSPTTGTVTDQLDINTTGHQLSLTLDSQLQREENIQASVFNIDYSVGPSTAIQTQHAGNQFNVIGNNVAEADHAFRIINGNKTFPGSGAPNTSSLLIASSTGTSVVNNCLTLSSYYDTTGQYINQINSSGSGNTPDQLQISVGASSGSASLLINNAPDVDNLQCSFNVVTGTSNDQTNPLYTMVDQEFTTKKYIDANPVIGTKIQDNNTSVNTRVLTGASDIQFQTDASDLNTLQMLASSSEIVMKPLNAGYNLEFGSSSMPYINFKTNNNDGSGANLQLLNPSVGVTELLTSNSFQLNYSGSKQIDFGSSAINLNTQKISGCVDPTSLQDVATKNYVDSVITTPTQNLIAFAVAGNSTTSGYITNQTWTQLWSYGSPGITQTTDGVFTLQSGKAYKVTSTAFQNTGQNGFLNIKLRDQSGNNINYGFPYIANNLVTYQVDTGNQSVYASSYSPYTIADQATVTNVRCYVDQNTGAVPAFDCAIFFEKIN